MPKDEKKPVVLMVDDEADYISALRGWLSPFYEFVGLTSGDDLIGVLDGFKPDLVILDVRMPGKNGFELCSEMRAQERFADIPIVFLTGCREDEDFIKGLSAGSTAHLTKPVGRRQLLSLLRELLPQSRMTLFL